jgi:hypothetical protein
LRETKHSETGWILAHPLLMDEFFRITVIPYRRRCP